MADYCYEATVHTFGADVADKNDVRGLCGPDEMVMILCEGCDTPDHRGFHYVDSDGHCLEYCSNHEPSAELVELDRPDAQTQDAIEVLERDIRTQV